MCPLRAPSPVQGSPPAGGGLAAHEPLTARDRLSQTPWSWVTSPHTPHPHRQLFIYGSLEMVLQSRPKAALVLPKVVPDPQASEVGK